MSRRSCKPCRRKGICEWGGSDGSTRSGVRDAMNDAPGKAI